MKGRLDEPPGVKLLGIFGEEAKDAPRVIVAVLDHRFEIDIPVPHRTYLRAAFS